MIILTSGRNSIFKGYINFTSVFQVFVKLECSLPLFSPNPQPHSYFLFYKGLSFRRNINQNVSILLLPKWATPNEGGKPTAYASAPAFFKCVLSHAEPVQTLDHTHIIFLLITTDCTIFRWDFLYNRLTRVYQDGFSLLQHTKCSHTSSCKISVGRQFLLKILYLYK